MQAGIYSGVSPYHLAARIKQEVGPFITHKSISGDVEGYAGLYNFYNIGATSSTAPLGAIKNGLQYALNGKGSLSQNELENQLIPWDSPLKSIKGGAVFIGKSYILVGQNCLYLQKFDVNDDRTGNQNDLFWHQYMTNCLAPYSEAKSIYNGYSTLNMLDSSIGFVIPIYENMPSMTVSSPNINENDFILDNTKVYANVSTRLNIRTGPGTSYESLIMVPANEVFTRIGKGIQNGERWDKVLLSNGMVGYAFQTYVVEVPEPTVNSIKLSVNNTLMNVGETQKISIEITPVDAKTEIIWKSSNDSIAMVQNGNVTAISNGTVIITAQTLDGTVSDSIELTINVPVESIELDNYNIEIIEGSSMKLKAVILPQNATNKEIEWSSEDTNIADVNENGEVFAKSEGETVINVKIKNENKSTKCIVKVIKIKEGFYLEFKDNIKVNGNEISNIGIIKISEFNKLIKTNLYIEFYDSKNNLIDDDSVQIGTGYRLCVKDEIGNEIYNYYFIIYGDVNGDGYINSLDVLVLQKYILELRSLDNLYLKAGNISGNGNLPSSLDVLKIQKHILEIKFIE